ncbi:RxLR-like protein [Plasmopara halstedii]|uniref:RxLR-like protein n=1 Tax=Plasmopara halstedii TaxID=4781 RepID=A0A0P1AI17_PLAHL|nr:RxLR-like protein [Plasmopara halstedii]CEG40132.1 RxLR-like protein [Plasmopara halstedii]|eukprot:XP_024576501.1 RxLR-like protein [Plasmopara halstedii]
MGRSVPMVATGLASVVSGQFEVTPRIDRSGRQWCSLCMVAEPQRSFRQQVATTFKARCLADFLYAE